MRNSWLVILLVVASGVLSSCGPRGESKSLDEILALAQQRYEQAQSRSIDGEVKSLLTKIDQNITALLAGGETKNVVNGIAETLSTLTPKAGTTSRPALHELTMQFRTAAEDASGTLSTAEKKLMASRVYGILSAELEAVGFRVQDPR